MPKLFPNGRDILSGVGGDGRIKINGKTPPLLEGIYGGSWAVRDADRVLGNATDNGEDWGLWQYTISLNKLEKLNEEGATNTYGGGGKWSTYLASNPPVTRNSDGMNRSDIVPRDISPDGVDLYCTPGNDKIFIRNGDTINTGLFLSAMYNKGLLWCSAEKPFLLFNEFFNQIITPFSGGNGARFAIGKYRDWICQWCEGVKQLIVYPMDYNGEIGELYAFELSGDEHDFNHDIGYDGKYITIVTGYDSTESSTRFYEVDTDSGAFRVNGGEWKIANRVRVDIPPAPIPIPPNPEPIPPNPIPPNPIPPNPNPIPPASVFSHLKELTHMDYPGIYGVRYGTEKGFLFGRLEPGSIDIIFDLEGPAPTGRCEVTKIDDTHFMIRFVEANRIITFLGTSDIAVNGRARHFETRPVEACGPSESPDIKKYPSDDLILACVRYLTHDGSWAMSTGLTLVRWE